MCMVLNIWEQRKLGRVMALVLCVLLNAGSSYNTVLLNYIQVFVQFLHSVDDLLVF